jgi:hypothetical protein
MFRTDPSKTVAASLCALLFSSIMVLSAVGPARASDLSGSAGACARAAPQTAYFA